MTYERQFFQYLDNLKRNILTQPLNLGGVSSSGGGVGGPPGGFLGLLPQSKITYDKLEAASASTPSSGASLLDNLNHIRHQITTLSGAGGSVAIQEDDVQIVAEATVINFEGSVDVTDNGGGKVTVLVSGGSVSFLGLTDTPSTYVGQAGKVPVVSAGEVAMEFTTISGVNYNYTTEDLTSQIPAGSDNYILQYTPISGSTLLFYNGIAQQFNNFTVLTSGVHTKFSPVSGDELITTYYRDAGSVTGITTVSGDSSTAKPFYIMSAHNKEDKYAYLLGSSDGKEFQKLHRKPIYVPASGSQRDPALLLDTDDYHWVCHTNSTNSYFTVIKSNDFSSWEVAANVDMSDIANLHYVWAPQWFVDSDGTVHVFVACSTSSSTSNFQIYEVHPTNTAMSSWSTPVAITISGESNVIDPFVVLKNSTYYMWYKQETTDYIQYASSATLTGTYTNVETGDWAGWGKNPIENPVLIQIDDDTWRIYFQEHDGFDPAHEWYSESTDDWSTWSTPIEIDMAWIPGGPSVTKTTDRNIIQQLQSIKLQGNRKVGTNVLMDGTQTITTSTSTPISWDTVVRDEDSMYTSGTKVYAKYPGWYSFTVSVNWAGTGSTGKRVLDLRLNGSTYISSASSGADSDDPGPNMVLTMEYFLDPTEYAELVVWHNYGSDLDVDYARMIITYSP